MISNERSCFAEIITNKSPNYVDLFHQKDAGPVLLAHTWENFVTLSVLHFPQFEPNIEEFTYENLTDIEHGPSILKCAWSPRTSMLIHPVCIIFCTIGLDFQLRLVSVDNKMKVSIKIIGQHKSFVNDCSFQPIRGNQVASVGDDKKCRIWNVDSCEEEMCIPLTSAGKSVKWNPNDPTKLLVAEQNGCVRLYDTVNYQPVLSLNCLRATSGLSSCDWSILNPLKIGAVIGKEWHVWDMSRGSLPVSSGQAHTGCGREFRWSNCNDAMFSTRGTPNNQAKVFLGEDKLPISIQTKVGHGISWHNLLPVCAIGGNRKILLYEVDVL
ncbi:nucleoporin Nup37-like [Hydractinia symbiolongicarpus]|uniref:nucleoporin Nup37-like n=1 Tax=Hydractinia symbiolongicarpus TaxID=13093 RepID=UPI00254AFD91|nr:nucleoporin Nup37-like [Hydractinia symbiolongicarpus]